MGLLQTPSQKERQGGRVRRLLQFVRSLVDVRAALLQSKEIAVKASLLVRLANPITLVVVLAATALSVILVFVTAVAAAILLLG